MKFQVKDMGIATGDILIAILNKQDAKLLDLHPEDRIKLIRHNREVTAILDLSESNAGVPPRSIGLFEEVLAALHAKDGDIIHLEFEQKPESVLFIREKLKGKRLNYKKTYSIVRDIVDGRLTSIEKTYFVSATYTRGLLMSEIVDLTRAIVNTGDRLNFKDPVFDKHCIGGIPANRTTMVIVPIVTAAGLLMPKTSSRAITSPAGTADTMEVLANVTLPISKLKRVVKKTNGCIVWGGAMNLAPADDKIIEIEHPLALDVEGQMLASVMAKKASVSASHILIDIPCGPHAKCKTNAHAIHLKKQFELLAHKLRMKIHVIITDGSKPIGNGIGPTLEARDVQWILQNDESAPQDLREKSLMMAGKILEMAGIKAGYKKATEILESGDAHRQMQRIITAQGEQQKRFLSGKFSLEVKSSLSGRVRVIDNNAISRIARAAGAPEDKGAGLYLHKGVGDMIKRKEALYTLYSESYFKLSVATEVINKLQPYIIR